MLISINAWSYFGTGDLEMEMILTCLSVDWYACELAEGIAPRERNALSSGVLPNLVPGALYG
jgi:hypothetical protein